MKNETNNEVLVKNSNQPQNDELQMNSYKEMEVNEVQPFKPVDIMEGFNDYCNNWVLKESKTYRNMKRGKTMFTDSEYLNEEENFLIKVKYTDNRSDHIRYYSFDFYLNGIHLNEDEKYGKCDSEIPKMWNDTPWKCGILKGLVVKGNYLDKMENKISKLKENIKDIEQKIKDFKETIS